MCYPVLLGELYSSHVVFHGEVRSELGGVAGEVELNDRKTSVEFCVNLIYVRMGHWLARGTQSKGNKNKHRSCAEIRDLVLSKKCLS